MAWGGLEEAGFNQVLKAFIQFCIGLGVLYATYVFLPINPNLESIVFFQKIIVLYLIFLSVVVAYIWVNLPKKEVKIEG